MSNKFLKKLISTADDGYASIVSEGIIGTTKGYIDTGSYALNALISGSIFKGIPNNKILGFAGEEATGKTYFTLGILKKFQDQNPDGIILYFDTENALTQEMFSDRGMDLNRIAVISCKNGTVEEFRTKCFKILEEYLKTDVADRQPMIIVLDSLGMLSTEKEVNDTAEGKNVRDMTRSQIIKSAFRTLTSRLGVAQVPLIVTNHLYDVIGCLTEESLVLMEDGSNKPINEIQIGDIVKTMSGCSNVTETFEYNVDQIIEIELSDGTVFRATPNHKFMTKNGEWKTVSELSEGDVILSI
jgi:RecA/RadA recombinase